eukprot:gene11986-10338_t
MVRALLRRDVILFPIPLSQVCPHREQVNKHYRPLTMRRGRDSDSESDDDYIDNPDLPCNWDVA